jgi:hypothetical protein
MKIRNEQISKIAKTNEHARLSQILPLAVKVFQELTSLLSEESSAQASLAPKVAELEGLEAQEREAAGEVADVRAEASQLRMKRGRKQGWRF